MRRRLLTGAARLAPCCGHPARCTAPGALLSRLNASLHGPRAIGLTVGEFKEGATIAYHHVAELYAAAGAATNAGDVPNKRDAVPEGGKAGEDRIAEEAEGMVDKYLLQALRKRTRPLTSACVACHVASTSYGCCAAQRGQT